MSIFSDSISKFVEECEKEGNDLDWSTLDIKQLEVCKRSLSFQLEMIDRLIKLKKGFEELEAGAALEQEQAKKSHKNKAK